MENIDERQILVVGTGSEARIAADIYTAMGHVILGFLETDPDRNIRELNDVNVVGHYDDDAAKAVLKDSRVEFVVAVGDIAERVRVYSKLSKRAKRPSANAIHPLSWQSPYATLGFGNLFNAGVVVNANTVIGDMNHFHSGVTVETDARIGNYCNFSAGVRIGGNVTVDDAVFIGTGAVIYPGVHLGEGCMIGAGSVVLKSVDPRKKVFGNPAQVV